MKWTGPPFPRLELDNVLSIIKVSAAFFFRVRFDLIHRSSKKYCPSLIKTWRYFLLHFWYSRSENCVWKPGDTWLTRNNIFYPTQLFNMKSVLNNNSPWCEHLFLFTFLTKIEASYNTASLTIKTKWHTKWKRTMVKTDQRKLNLITQTNRWTDTEQIRSTNSTSHTNAWKLHNSYKCTNEGKKSNICIDKC